MRKIVLTYGLLCSLILCSVMFISTGYFMDHPNDFGMGEIVGFSSMIVAFSMVFFGIHRFREKVNGGSISFKKAFAVGISIVAVTSVVYVVGWLIYSSTVATDFGEKYMMAQEKKILESNPDVAAAQKDVEEMRKTMTLYENNILVKIFFTLMEIFPLGLLITLIAALVLKKGNKSGIGREPLEAGAV